MALPHFIVDTSPHQADIVEALAAIDVGTQAHIDAERLLDVITPTNEPVMLRTRLLASSLVATLLRAGGTAMPSQRTAPRVAVGPARKEYRDQYKDKTAAAQAKRERKAAKRAALLSSGKIVNQPIRGVDTLAPGVDLEDVQA